MVMALLLMQAIFLEGTVTLLDTKEGHFVLKLDSGKTEAVRYPVAQAKIADGLRVHVAGFRSASGLDGSVTIVDMKAPRTVRGKVTSVDKAKREVRMTDRESGGAVTIHLLASAKLRTIPRFVARSIAVGGTLHPEGAGLGASVVLLKLKAWARAQL